jgi:hypothetical protein
VRREGQVKFDGCAVWDPRHQLLEAKGPGYEGLAQQAIRYGFYRTFGEKQEDQARRQGRAARGRRVEWHVAEGGAIPFFREITDPQPSIRVQNTPPR